VIDYLAHHDVVAADVGVANVRGAWANADPVLRVWAGVPRTNNIHSPERLFDSHNIGSVDLKAQESTWYGKVDYVAKYKKLWGVTGA
jgi:hypothetical protein